VSQWIATDLLYYRKLSFRVKREVRLCPSVCSFHLRNYWKLCHWNV